MRFNFITVLGIYFIVSVYIFIVPLTTADSHNIPLAGDLQIPIYPENFIKYYYPLWSDHFEKNNLIQITKYPALLFIFIPIYAGFDHVKVLVWFWIFSATLAGSSAFLASTYVLKREGFRDKRIIYLAGFIAGFFFLFNPFFALQSRHMMIRLTYALIPLLFFIFCQTFERQNFKWIFLSSVIWIFLMVNPRGLLYGIILMVISYIYIVNLNSDKFSLFDREKIKIATKIFIIFSILSSYWSFPLLFSKISGESVNPGYILSEDKLYGGAKTNFSKSMMLNVPNIGAGKINAFNPKIEIISKISFLIHIIGSFILLLCFVPIITHRISKSILIFYIFSLSFIGIISILSINYLWDLYVYFAMYSPLSSAVGWMFRKTFDYYPLMMFSISILIGISVINIFKLIKNKGNFHLLLTTVFLLVLMSILSWPLLTGDFNGEFKPLKIPNEYFVVNDYIKINSNNYSKAMWIPKFDTSKISWGNKRPLRAVIDMSSSIPTYFLWGSGGADRKKNDVFIEYISSVNYRFKDDILQSEKTNELGEILAILNIKYLVYQDKIFTNNNISLLNILLNQKDINLKNKIDFIYIFENKQYDDKIFRVYTKFVVLENNLDRILSVSHGTLNLKDIPIIFYTPKILDMLNRSGEDYIIENIEELTNILLLKSDEATIIKPFDIIKTSKPKKYWSRDSTNLPGGSYWKRKYFIDGWLSDYDYGLIFTFTDDVNASLPFTVQHTGKYRIFIRYFENKDGGVIRIYLKDDVFNISTKSQLNRFNWVYFDNLYLEKGTHNLIIENVKGLNAVNIIVVIPEQEYIKILEQAKNLMKNKYTTYILEAETDFHRYSTVVVGNVTYSGGYAVYIGNGTMWRDVYIPEDGKYIFAVNGNGPFELLAGDKLLTINATVSNKTIYIPSYLNKGRISIKVKSLANNLLKYGDFERIAAGIPEGWYIDDIKSHKVRFGHGYSGRYSLMVSTSNTDRVRSRIVSEPIDVSPGKEYVFIAYTKRYNVKPPIIQIEAYYPKRGVWESLSSYVIGGDANEWNEYSTIIRIPKDSNKIRIVLNARWALNKVIGDGITWFDDIQLVPLDKSPKLDRLIIYSAKNNETLEQIFYGKDDSAKVIKYDKLDPTTWLVTVKSTKPFLLTFAEAYDPLWEAKVYKSGKIVYRTKSVPVYSIINGFWINETGTLDVVIRYKPQEWFEKGMIIFALAFIIGVVYSAYIWKQEIVNR